MNPGVLALVGRLRIATPYVHSIVSTPSFYSEDGGTFWFKIVEEEEVCRNEIQFSDLSFYNILFDSTVPPDSCEIVERLVSFVKGAPKRSLLCSSKTLQGIQTALEINLKAYFSISFIAQMNPPMDPPVLKKVFKKLNSGWECDISNRSRKRLMDPMCLCVGCLCLIANCCFYLDRLKDAELAGQLARHIIYAMNPNLPNRHDRDVVFVLARVYAEMGRRGEVMVRDVAEVNRSGNERYSSLVDLLRVSVTHKFTFSECLCDQYLISGLEPEHPQKRDQSFSRTTGWRSLFSDWKKVDHLERTLFTLNILIPFCHQEEEKPVARYVSLSRDWSRYRRRQEENLRGMDWKTSLASARIASMDRQRREKEKLAAMRARDRSHAVHARARIARDRARIQKRLQRRVRRKPSKGRRRRR